MKKKWFFTGIIAIICSFAIIFLFSRGVDGTSNTNIQLFESVLQEIENNFIDEVDQKELTYEAIKGIVQKIDLNSYFLTLDEYKKMQEFRASSVAKFGGIGAKLQIADSKENNQIIGKNGLEIIGVVDAGPADKSGLKKGDCIIAIDRKPIEGLPLEETVSTIKGDPKTIVILTVARKGQAPVEISVMREEVVFKNVNSRIIGNMAYIKIDAFDHFDTALEIRQTIYNLTSKNRINGIILDPSSNPGGYLVEAIYTIDIFLGAGKPVVKSVERKSTITYSTSDDSNDCNLALVILIDKNSASASEIVAGSLQNYGRAIIIGEKTYGKGTVQIIKEFPDGSALGLTIARYFLGPNDKVVHKIGIEPNIKIDPKNEEAIIKKAIEELKKKK